MEGITKVERKIQETDVYVCTLSTTAACLGFGSTGVARAHAKRVFVVPTDVEIVALAWLVWI
jgi:hypothetical protein